MANIYEFELRRDIVKALVEDTGLSLSSDAKGNIIDNLMSIVDRPNTFQKVSMNSKPGLRIRVGRIQTEGFQGYGLHAFIHSGSEGYLDMLEFDKRLKNSLERQGIIFTDRTQVSAES